MIVDAHIHLYPPEVSAEPTAWAKIRGETQWLATVQPQRGPRLQGWPSLDQLLSDMDAAGVDQVVMQSWYWENHDTCAESLAWTIPWLRAHPDRIRAFAPFHAAGGSAAIELLERAFEAGFCGIGELHPPAQGYAYDDAVFAQALELAAANGKPVCLHVTEPAGRDYAGRIETPFQALQNLAPRHQETHFIFAHLGGLLPFHELNPSTRDALKNVWYDTAAVPLLYRNDIYTKLATVIDPSRILFGTDYPLRTFPKLQAAPSFQHHIDDLRNSGLAPEAVESILGRNVSDLLNSQAR